jgi:hypothetical protein
MKTFVIITIILLTIALVFVALPQDGIRTLLDRVEYLVSVVLSQDGIRTLPGRVEYLSEPEPETVEYIAAPPAELGKQLLSPWVSKQCRDNAWSNARGKWVVWKGDVRSIEPMLKPSRIIFIYEYEAPPPFTRKQFGVVAKFNPEWTEDLKQLVRNETVYYRARLVRQELDLVAASKYGLGWSPHFLVLEDGQIIDSNDVAAQLADLVYTSYRQLEKLVEEAENIAAVSKFFEDKLRDGEKRIVIETMLGLIGIKIRDKYWLLEETPLLELRARKNSLRLNIQHHLQEALSVLHHSDPSNDAMLRQEIEETFRSNNIMVEEAKAVSKILKDFWEEEKRSAEPGISDAALALFFSKLPPLSAARTIIEGAIEYGKLDAYETIVGACHLQLGFIESSMEQIHDNVVEVINEVIETGR